ncbi:MAG: hypothetical protein H6696_14665 [Deferribacteres bacterium]|nr:hypothetical protein [candidate division KSB1 bacterium]MCB9503170.1 hypothetical protein [Deferribacteres bacterium]
MFCPKCGQKSTRKSKYCTGCGAGLSRNTRKVRTKAARHNKSFSWFPLILVCLALIVIVVVYPGKNNKRSQPGKDHSIRSFAVLEIAEGFDCFCGECDHQLKECECGHKNGAKEVKNFIAQKLKEGHHKPHVVDMVKEKYGSGKLIFPADSVKLFKG